MNSNIFFASDPHFGHKSVLNFCPCFRNFRSEDEMDYRLISFGTLVEHMLDVPFKGDYVCKNTIYLVEETFPKMDLNIGSVLVNFDIKLENNPKGVKK